MLFMITEDSSEGLDSSDNPTRSYHIFQCLEASVRVRLRQQMLELSGSQW